MDGSVRHAAKNRRFCRPTYRIHGACNRRLVISF